MPAHKYIALINGRLREIIATVISSGAPDDGKAVALDASGRLDVSVMPVGLGAETKSIQATENLSASDLVNIWNSAGNPRVRRADASVTGKEATGFILAGVTSGANALVYLEGTVTGLSGLTPGERLYLATTPGAVTATPPSSANNVVQYIGTAITSTEFTFEPDPGIILA